MTITPATPAAPTDEVLRLLADGTTSEATAEQCGWPRSRVLAVINGQRGWLLDPATDKVYMPGKTSPPQADFRPTRPAQPATPAPPAMAEDATTVLPVHTIDPHPGNIRTALGDLDELADSIRVHGILQPLVVCRHPSRPGGYQLLAGHRRMAAAQMAGLRAVPVVIRSDVGDGAAIEVMLIENCHRADLSPMEKADAFAKLRDRGYSQTRIAARTGISQSTVSYHLALTDLDESSQERVRTGELGAGDAVAAVRKARQKTRKGQGRTADYSWEPDFLAGTHPLAKKAKRLCEAREHTMRRRIGKTACGQCWETVIRADEQVVVKAALGSSEVGA